MSRLNTERVMNKKLNVIENTCTAVKPKSTVIPVLGIIVFGTLLWWIGNHVYGGCVGMNDVFTYCQITTK